MLVQYDRVEELNFPIIIGYAVLVNVLGLFVMFLDKRRAVLKMKRISENMLFRITALGGGIGTTLGMKLFRHKTKHRHFTILMPLMTVVQYLIVLGWNLQ